MRVMLDIYDDIVPPDEKDADKPKEEEEEGDDVDAVEKEKQKPTPPVLSVEDALKSEIESIKDKVLNLRQSNGETDIYAIIIEPINASSMRSCSEKFLKKLREICTKNNIIL